MPSRFVKLTREEFADLLHRFDFTRRVDAVHMHHTWRPTHADYRGEATIEAMWRYHTQEKGWRDIAQHITIAPDGAIWTGRNWNLPPASAVGFNGNDAAGPFMFETIGDFDKGRDRLEGAQLETVIDVIARVQDRFSLGPDSLRFHRFMTNLKSCPGTGVEIDPIRAAVEAARGGLHAAGGARGAEAWAGTERLRIAVRVDEALRGWQGTATRALDPPDVELEESAMSDEHARLAAGLSGTTRPAPGVETRAARGPELTPEMLAELRPHVVNLNQGRFSTEGIFQTSAADVDAIFDDHLVRAADAAQAAGQPLRLLFWAHGGLISEASGLWIAHLQVAWWKRNGVYPIHFAWETGFFDALQQILGGTRAPAPRGVARDVWDHTTDLAVEAAARTLGGGKIWSAMKRSAELASESDGGATYVAQKLQRFCAARGNQVELHAVGHSAGSIFHAHFLPMAFGLGIPALKTLQFLAPAVRMDEFKARLLRHVGQAVQSLTMFTMQRDWEAADNVAQVYRKSLLYLIHFALERERKTPILGLEISIREDGEVADLFGLRGQRTDHAEVVWSVTQATSGASATTSQSHGGFDNNRPTMDSVAHRILGAPPGVTFPDEAIQRAAFAWHRPPDVFTDGAFVPMPLRPAAPAPQVVTHAPPAAATGNGGHGGARRALCVGIDRYPTMPLAGCVADARDWASALETLGFETTLLLDDAATRSRILEDLRHLIAASAAGDVIAFQFAGHGTEVDDIDGDEVDGTNGARDEALCPYDIAQGALVIDDDLAEVFAEIPEGVNVTCFMDCCHSGTITRVMVGPAAGDGGGDVRARFLPATPEVQAAHRKFRERLGATRGRAPARRPADMRQVVFSACRDFEVAFESDGHGAFTVRATRLLASGIAGVSHDEFQRRVTAAFGEAARQHPDLDCTAPARGRALLGSLAAGSAVPAVVGGNGRGPAPSGVVALAHALRKIADELAPGS